MNNESSPHQILFASGAPLATHQHRVNPKQSVEFNRFYNVISRPLTGTASNTIDLRSNLENVLGKFIWIYAPASVVNTPHVILLPTPRFRGASFTLLFSGLGCTYNLTRLDNTTGLTGILSCIPDETGADGTYNPTYSEDAFSYPSVLVSPNDSNANVMSMPLQMYLSRAHTGGTPNTSANRMRGKLDFVSDGMYWTVTGCIMGRIL